MFERNDEADQDDAVLCCGLFTHSAGKPKPAASPRHTKSMRFAGIQSSVGTAAIDLRRAFEDKTSSGFAERYALLGESGEEQGTCDVDLKLEPRCANVLDALGVSMGAKIGHAVTPKEVTDALLSGHLGKETEELWPMQITITVHDMNFNDPRAVQAYGEGCDFEGHFNCALAPPSVTDQTMRARASGVQCTHATVVRATFGSWSRAHGEGAVITVPNLTPAWVTFLSTPLLVSCEIQWKSAMSSSSSDDDDS